MSNINNSNNSIWPPKLGSVVAINLNKDEYIARVAKIISNNTAAICILINNTDYVEKYLELNYKINGKGLILLLPSYRWRYLESVYNIVSVSDQPTYQIDISNLDNIVDSDNNYNIDIKQIVRDKYDKFIIHAQNINSNEIGIDTNRPRSDGLSGNITQRNGESNDITDNVKGILDHNLLTKKGEPDLNYLFMDDKYTDIHITDNNGDTCHDPDSKNQEILKNKLNMYEELTPDEIGIATSKVVSFDNIINSKRDEEWEGRKIINWIESRLNADFKEFMGGSQFVMSIKNGYVHVHRSGCETDDYITSDLLGKELEYFTWQDGRPIDYNTLKYTIFRNSTQTELIQDQQQLEEAKLILSQEYLIALHPLPQYQMWCLKRLLLCWYADSQLIYNIRKIKVLINQYRAIDDKEYNKIHGILPSIVVYPKYGIDSAKTVLKVLSDYFVFYEPLGWSSNPTYFIRMNQLIHYTNGLMDLKMYYRNVLSKSDDKRNVIFNNRYTNIENFKDPFNIIKLE